MIPSCRGNFGKLHLPNKAKMSAITTTRERKIIEDFAKEISKKKYALNPPSKFVINFRTDRADGRERTVYRVPIDLLRYRMHNGRIASDVMHYEKNVGILSEEDDEAQAKLKSFLERKDPQKTADLYQSIHHSGQLEPAIITCDGFLINGNRRKMVIENLNKEHPDNNEFTYMKVVILPGKDDEGGPPNLLEIEQIENRYQLQSEGKSEYYGFDRALSIKRKIEIGLSLQAQLRDDPRYASVSAGVLKKEVKKYEKDYLNPLNCVDRYLRQFRRDGQYGTISSGSSDSKGRWQAFTDYSATYERDFKSATKRIQYGIEEQEVGDIEAAAFHIIRLRNLQGLPKLHAIMRDLAKYCRTQEGKKAIKKIAKEVQSILPNNENYDNAGRPLKTNEIDVKWAAKYQQSIIYHTKKAENSYKNLKEKETPLGLLEAAYKKLTHDAMDLSKIAISDLSRARELAASIRNKADQIESKIYHLKKNYKKLGTRRA